MSEKFTEVTAPSGGLGLWDHVEPEEAIRLLRRHYEVELETARAVLDELDRGSVEVFHQYGPYARANRRKVYP